MGRTAKVAEVRRQERWAKSKNNNLGNRGESYILHSLEPNKLDAALDNVKSRIFNNPNRTKNVPLRLRWAHFKIHLLPLPGYFTNSLLRPRI
jgi:hypothetical protein